MKRNSEQFELLSAYHDGELSPDERAMVEDLLARDPYAKTMLATIQSMSTVISAMPSFSLDESLADPILENAEQLMMLDTSVTTDWADPESVARTIGVQSPLSKAEQRERATLAKQEAKRRKRLQKQEDAAARKEEKRWRKQQQKHNKGKVQFGDIPPEARDGAQTKPQVQRASGFWVGGLTKISVGAVIAVTMTCGVLWLGEQLKQVDPAARIVHKTTPETVSPVVPSDGTGEAGNVGEAAKVSDIPAPLPPLPAPNVVSKTGPLLRKEAPRDKMGASKMGASKMGPSKMGPRKPTASKKAASKVSVGKADAMNKPGLVNDMFPSNYDALGQSYLVPSHIDKAQMGALQQRSTQQIAQPQQIDQPQFKTQSKPEERQQVLDEQMQQFSANAIGEKWGVSKMPRSRSGKQAGPPPEPTNVQAEQSGNARGAQQQYRIHQGSNAPVTSKAGANAKNSAALAPPPRNHTHRFLLFCEVTSVKEAEELIKEAASFHAVGVKPPRDEIRGDQNFRVIECWMPVEKQVALAKLLPTLAPVKKTWTLWNKISDKPVTVPAPADAANPETLYEVHIVQAVRPESPPVAAAAAMETEVDAKAANSPAPAAAGSPDLPPPPPIGK